MYTFTCISSLCSRNRNTFEREVGGKGVKTGVELIVNGQSRNKKKTRRNSARNRILVGAELSRVVMLGVVTVEHE